MSEAFTTELIAQFAAAQRWQLPVFDGATALGRASGLHTARQLDDIEASAHADGLARGHEEGFAAGLAEARHTTEQLKSLLDHLSRPLAELDAEVERTLVALTIEMARRLAHLEMDLDPSRVAHVVREAVSALGNAPRDVRVYLHPQDAEATRRVLASSDEAAGWKLIPDAELNRGDCRILCDGASVDARLDTRQATLAQQLLGEDA